ncbi:MAG: small, acid-soluble spore protein, alpha/beta type [Bacillus sp. (in: Bacteria)]|nr:small, acid-soluble spore protein, alpha/beta type [Bacillus sp. (in: firmicutes)]
MVKRNPLDVEGTDKFMHSYSEEIAQEFGIFFSTTQAEHKANISAATGKAIHTKRKGPK